MKAFSIAPGFAATVESIGIVRDAESNPRGAFQSACSALRNAQLPVPPKPRAAAAGSPQVNVLILPDPATPGMLETLCLQAVAQDPVMPCVEEFFRCADQRGVSSPGNPWKARAHAFLSSRPKPDLLIGRQRRQAAGRGTTLPSIH